MNRVTIPCCDEVGAQLLLDRWIGDRPEVVYEKSKTSAVVCSDICDEAQRGCS